MRDGCTVAAITAEPTKHCSAWPTENKVLCVLACAPTQDYYKVVYAGPELFTRYHREQNNDTTASVTAWDGSKRDVNFSLKLNLPQVLKNMLGE